jgi:hypothetical protein
MKGGNTAVSKVDKIWNDFFNHRVKDLSSRFRGWYRAKVVETNDPLRMHRVRFKMPELHDEDLKPEECPWAVPDPSMGGKRAGFWPGICKGDWVWINFEKGHPYGPIWSGAADPTRRKMYTLESIYGKTQIAVNEKGEPAEAPEDYDEDYLPKDNRPMSTGFRDRYGNLLYIGAVGFYPKEHEKKPASVGTDPVTQGGYKASEEAPEKNKPDLKMMAMMSKYGNYLIMSDIGYDWKQEFDGDFEEDEDFEIKRWKYLQKQLSEDEHEEVDERRMEMRTRFGHKFEMRDVGWKKARPEEFDKAVDLTEVEGKNEKEQVWIKYATKDGCYLRMWSKGADLEKNNFIKRLNKSDVGTKPYDEDKFGDGQGDTRGFYLCSPRQQIFAIDDAGSDQKDPQNKEQPYPNGIFMGGWRDGHFFGCEYNLKDELQRWLMYTSSGMGLEINQKWKYIALTTNPPQTISRKFDGPYKRVPWALKTYKGLNVEKYSYHLVLDEKNKYVRLKTPKFQGIEARDGGGENGCGGTWMEMRDEEDRGIWMSKDNNFAIWRGKKKKKYICINDDTDYIIVRNGIKNVQIFAQKDVEVIAKGAINMQAGGAINMSAGGAVNIRGAVVKAGPVLKTQDLYMQSRCGSHPAVYIPRHIAGTARCGDSPSSVSPSPMECKPLKPEDFDEERGCDPTKPQKGPVDPKVVHCGGGQGSRNESPPETDPETGDNPDVFDPAEGPPDIVETPSAGPPPPAPPVEDPLDDFSQGGSGILWFGTSSNFEDDISNNGLQRLALSNPFFDPEVTPPIGYIPLAISNDVAGADKFAGASVQKYGGNKLIYRLVAVDDGSLLEKDPIDPEVIRYNGDSIREIYLEVFDTVTT